MMIFRRKKCVWQFFLAACSVMLIIWLFRESSPEFYTQELPLDNFIPRFQDTIEDFSGRTSQRETCISSVDTIKVTANFTTNEILDGMRINYIPNDISAESTISRKEAVANDVHGLEATPLEIIVMPHSHNDPGWKKTYMQYYQDQTRHILDQIVEKLNQYTDMTFVWVESCFLNTWWTNQTQETQEQFRRLVKSGRLELVSGMWVAPDEASTHYFALIDQLIEGHYWVKEHIGVIPETSLNFDQFGYSSSIPYLMKLAGLKNVLIKRIHRGLKYILGKNKWMGFTWRQFWDPSGTHDIFGQVDTYEWMSISDSCGPDRAICRGLDFSVMPDLPEPGSPEAQKALVYDRATGSQASNLDDFVQKVVRQFKLKSSNYPHRVMMLPHGGDFHYALPEAWNRQYRNMKLFMDYVNERTAEFNVHMRFGTFKDYFTELERQKSKFGIKYPILSGDFFTYTESNEYWTGYFTTRQFDKRLSREVQESLRAAELIIAILFRDKSISGSIPTDTKRSMLASLAQARQELGIFQHHDAITGTSQEHVAADYEKRLSSAFTATRGALSCAIEYLLKKGHDHKQNGHVKSLLFREGHNELTNQIPINIVPSGTKVIILNSFTQKRQDIISLTLKTTSGVIVLDENDIEIGNDIVSRASDGVTIMFRVSMPALSFKVYTIKPALAARSNNNADAIATAPKSVSKPENLICENKYVNVTFSLRSGSPELICYKSLNLCTKFDIDWRYYKGMGGAYTMISNGVEVSAYDLPPTVKTIKVGTICGVESTFQYFRVVHSLQLSEGITAMAVKSEIWSDLTKYRGFNGDLAMRMRTDIVNNRTFYTDSNGMQLLGRKFRESLPFDASVYPITSMAVLEDHQTRLIVHSAQPHGVTSRSSGLFDVMIDRVALRPEMDMPEPVSDNKLTKTTFYTSFEYKGQYQTPNTQETALPSVNSVYLNDLLQHPLDLFVSTDITSNFKKSSIFLQKPLSCDVTLANVKNLVKDDLEPDGTSVTLFRRSVSCDSKAKGQFCKVFKNTNIKLEDLLGIQSGSIHISEMYLSLLQEKHNMAQINKIDLRPMDVKTFLIN